MRYRKLGPIETHCLNLWVNWALYATLGRLNEADGIMEQYGPQVHEGARLMRERFPFELRSPLWRGVLLDPTMVAPSRKLPATDHATFVSFSEERDVACWFADPDSVMSGYVRERHPERACGWLIDYTDAKPDDVLFHWSWAERFEFPGIAKAPLWIFAKPHPEMIPDQVEWAMRTQREVILTVPREPLALVRYESESPERTAQLDDRYTFPAFRENPNGPKGTFFIIERPAKPNEER